mmetsp:Transcript_39537/g.93031  ORF Transcript_39537/g.93031 Transcript_39537/m.93031 type:complete len:258 (+) Transcript_39537:351-1124(+)
MPASIDIQELKDLLRVSTKAAHPATIHECFAVHFVVAPLVEILVPGMSPRAARVDGCKKSFKHVRGGSINLSKNHEPTAIYVKLLPKLLSISHVPDVVTSTCKLALVQASVAIKVQTASPCTYKVAVASLKEPLEGFFRCNANLAVDCGKVDLVQHIRLDAGYLFLAGLHGSNCSHIRCLWIFIDQRPLRARLLEPEIQKLEVLAVQAHICLVNTQCAEGCYGIASVSHLLACLYECGCGTAVTTTRIQSLLPCCSN